MKEQTNQESPRYEIRKLDPAEAIIKRLNQRVTLLEKRVDEQEAWVTMLLEEIVKMDRDNIN